MALINCRECGKEISDQSQQCIHCGCPVVAPTQISTQKIYCKECGKEIKENLQYCSYCGAPIINTTQVNNDNLNNTLNLNNNIII